jgi:hypothetical protein
MFTHELILFGEGKIEEVLLIPDEKARLDDGIYQVLLEVAVDNLGQFVGSVLERGETFPQVVHVLVREIRCRALLRIGCQTIDSQVTAYHPWEKDWVFRIGDISNEIAWGQGADNLWVNRTDFLIQMESGPFRRILIRGHQFKSNPILGRQVKVAHGTSRNIGQDVVDRDISGSSG